MTTTSHLIKERKAVGVNYQFTIHESPSQVVCQSRLQAIEQGKKKVRDLRVSECQSNGSEMSIPLYIEQRQVGKFNSKTKQFIKPVQRSKHYFRKVSGYAVDADILDYLEAEGGREIVIVESDTGNSLKADLTTWKEKGRAGNWGFGKQQTLSEKYMERLGFES